MAPAEAEAAAAAAPAAAAPPAALAAAIPPPPLPGAEEPRGAAAAPPASKAAEDREGLKLKVFRRCDSDGDGFLSRSEMGRFACLVGFEGTNAEWDEEYSRLCQERDADAAVGIPLATVLQLLDDESDSGSYLSDEELRILCEVPPAPGAAGVAAAGGAGGAPELMSSADFSRWLDSAELPTDTVEFELDGGERVRAHAFILAARCEHFRRLLAQSARDKPIHVPGAGRAAVLSVFRFVYSGGAAAPPQELAAEVLRLADSFGLEGLRAQCLERLQEGVTVENALPLFLLCERLTPESAGLREQCVDVIRGNMERVCSSKAFQDICSSPELVKSLLLATCGEPPLKRQRLTAGGA